MTAEQAALAKKILNPGKLRFFMMSQLPMGLLAGLVIRHLNDQQTVVSVPFKWINKNPFRSIYFAVQSMAAEMSTATGCMLAVHKQKPSVAFIIVDMEARFLKKATDRVFFTCEENQKAFDAVARCLETGEATQATLRTLGKMADGTLVAEFTFTWSFKPRS